MLPHSVVRKETLGEHMHLYCTCTCIYPPLRMAPEVVVCETDKDNPYDSKVQCTCIFPFPYNVHVHTHIQFVYIMCMCKDVVFPLVG